MTTLFQFVFGQRPDDPQPMRKVKGSALPTIDAPPAAVPLHEVKPRDRRRFDATLARRDGSLRIGHGQLHYRAGEHYIVTDPDGEHFVVEREVFERTYRKRLLGGYLKRPDVHFRYFTLPYCAMISTPEGLLRADPGDWIMQGVKGELWPVDPQDAERKYQPA